MSVLKARDAKDVEAAVQWALGEERAIEIVGQGSKRGVGRPAQTDVTVDFSELSRVTLYEPEELVLSAEAGAAIADIEATVAAKGQQLAFEPMDYAAVLGGVAGRGTIGGVLAANLSGPRRIKAGAARDHFLGFTAVSGRGETFKSGGRVVKNVTGYDLCKLMSGSWGTLAAMTEVTIKTLPRPETEASVTLAAIADTTAVQAMTAAMGLSCDVSGAAHLPAAVCARSSIINAVASGRSLTVLRLEGVVPSVAHRQAMLQTALKPFGEVAVIDETVSRELWLAIRDVTPFAADRTDRGQPLWRISIPPTRGAELASEIRREAEGEVLYDWAGGLVWLLLAPSHDAGAGLVRRAIRRVGGHATLVRAPLAVRASVDVFEPQEPGLTALMRRVKDSFDPKGIFNPGRMWPGA